LAQQKKQSQSKEKAYRIGENICQLFIQQGFNIQNIFLKTQKLNIKRANIPINK
jgi:hypothetical protein